MYPDSEDPNLYYVGPNSYVIAKETSGVPEFSYVEIADFWGVKALVQTVMAAAYDLTDIAQVESVITTANPQARFTGIPFVSSQVKFGTLLAPFVERNDCTHRGGTIEGQESCNFTLTDKGRLALRENFERGLTLNMEYDYTVDGVLQQANGTYQPQTLTLGVAGKIGSAELASFPQLFVDSNGHVIEWKTADPATGGQSDNSTLRFDSKK
jgi:hypothetical protein